VHAKPQTGTASHSRHRKECCQNETPLSRASITCAYCARAWAPAIETTGKTCPLDATALVLEPERSDCATASLLNASEEPH